jgi:hypothetical protein
LFEWNPWGRRYQPSRRGGGSAARKFGCPAGVGWGTVRRMDEDGYFGERVGAAYDDSSEGMFDPA